MIGGDLIARLTFALLELCGEHYLDEEGAELRAWSAVEAAEFVDREGITPQLLLAMGHTESRHQRHTVSRKVCVGKRCKRRAGLYRSKSKPGNWRGPYYCGVLQVTATTWDECMTYVRDVEATYVVAAQHLAEWMDMRVCRKRKGDARLVCALRGYVGGFPAIRKKHSYARSVIRRSKTIMGKVNNLPQE